MEKKSLLASLSLVVGMACNPPSSVDNRLDISGTVTRIEYQAGETIEGDGIFTEGRVVKRPSSDRACMYVKGDNGVCYLFKSYGGDAMALNTIFFEGSKVHQKFHPSFNFDNMSYNIWNGNTTISTVPCVD